MNNSLSLLTHYYYYTYPQLVCCNAPLTSFKMLSRFININTDNKKEQGMGMIEREKYEYTPKEGFPYTFPYCS